METPPQSVDEVRAAAQDAVSNRGLRQVGREIPLSPTGLGKFLKGQSPQVPTLRKLREWMERDAAAAPAREREAAFAVLLRDVPAAEREDLRRAIEDLLHLPHSRPARRLVPCTWPGCTRMIPANAIGSHLRAHRMREGGDF